MNGHIWLTKISIWILFFLFPPFSMYHYEQKIHEGKWKQQKQKWQIKNTLVLVNISHNFLVLWFPLLRIWSYDSNAVVQSMSVSLACRKFRVRIPATKSRYNSSNAKCLMWVTLSRPDITFKMLLLWNKRSMDHIGNLRNQFK